MTTSNHQSETRRHWPRVVAISGFATAAFLIGMSLPFFNDEELEPRVVLDLPPPVVFSDSELSEGKETEQVAEVNEPTRNAAAENDLGDVAQSSEALLRTEPEKGPSFPPSEGTAGTEANLAAEQPPEADRMTTPDVTAAVEVQPVSTARLGQESGAKTAGASIADVGGKTEVGPDTDPESAPGPGTEDGNLTATESSGNSGLPTASASQPATSEPEPAASSGKPDDVSASETGPELPDPPQPTQTVAALPSVDVSVIPDPKTFDDTLEKTPANARPAEEIPNGETPAEATPTEVTPAADTSISAVEIAPPPAVGVGSPRALAPPPVPFSPTAKAEGVDEKTDLLTNRATVLRSEPTPEAEILLRIGADEKVVRIEEEPVGGYYFVTHDQGTGWAWSGNLRHDPAYGDSLGPVESGSRAVGPVGRVLSVTNLRAEPIIGSEVIVQLRPGEEVDLLDDGPHQGYYRVLHPNGEGWIWGKNLSVEAGADS